ncbi:MAG: hypothetical protein HY673_10845 [Chloroflexi bacterium]|nr:hypothetical protein [Chloroflexota bacterium]
MIDKIKAYILDFAEYDKEPLHIILGALLEEKLSTNVRDAVAPLLQLLNDGYIECYHHSSWSGDPYVRIPHLKEADLMRYVDLHEPEGFQEYPDPEQGGEYFFRTTQKGHALLEGGGPSTHDAAG